MEAGLVLQNGEVRRPARMPRRLMDTDFIIHIRQNLPGDGAAVANASVV